MKVDIPDLVDTTSSSKDFDPLKYDVPPEGNLQEARIIFIGEAPGWQEMRDSRPFVGEAGQLLNRILGLIGLPRFKCYLTNFCKTRIPGNNENLLWTEKGFRHEKYYELQNQLYQELAGIQGKLIIPLGNTAMRAFMEHPKFDKITKYRGSAYKTSDFHHLANHLPGNYVMPSLHPASATIRNEPMNFYKIMNDIEKGLELLDDPSVLDTQLTIHTRPTKTQVLDFLNEVSKQSETAFDIEATPEFVTCFALTLGPAEAMSIPLMDNHGNVWTAEDELEIWQATARILESTTLEKIAQNGMFDFMYMLRTMGIKVRNFTFDTMLAQHITWTDLPKGLDFLTSVYSYIVYYKDEGKQSHLKAIKDWDQYYEYNAKDAICTHMIRPKLERELDKLAGARENFNHMMELHAPLMEMEYRGILADVQGIANKRAELVNECSQLQQRLNDLAGKPLNPRSPLLTKFFYEEKGYPKYINRKTGNPRCDANALARLAKKGSKEAQVIRELRSKENLISKYFTAVTDSDDRLRCTYKIGGTLTGRLSSESTYFETGTNLQNQTPIFKQYLCADKDHILVEPDLAKAEAHVVAYLCQDENMIQAFESNIDVHTFNASKIFNVEIHEVSKKQRAMGKRVVHASNYKMGPQTFSDDLAVDDIFLSKTECAALLDAYNHRFPGLARWHTEIEDELTRTRILYNLFGRPKRFLGVLTQKTFRSAIAYKPQSTVGQLLNIGLINMANDPDLWPIKLLAQVHDSVLFQIHKDHIPDLEFILNRIATHLYHKFHYKGRSFAIGVDAKLGYNWGPSMVELPNFNEDSIYDALNKLD